MRPKYAKETKTYIENSKDQQTRTIIDSAGNTNPWGTWKPENPLKRIHNTIPRNPDNPLKGIRQIVPNGTWSQWPRGVNILTQG